MGFIFNIFRLYFGVCVCAATFLVNRMYYWLWQSVMLIIYFTLYINEMCVYRCVDDWVGPRCETKLPPEPVCECFIVTQYKLNYYNCNW